MADGRTYGDDEIREIFDLAVRSDEGGHPLVSNQDGLTLSELQEVGLEVGMDPDRIATAAATVVARRGHLPRGTSLGMPVSVGREIELPTTVTENGWDLLVAELRETFGARGQVSSRGVVRRWTADDVDAYLEPTASGSRLRLTARNGGARALNISGVVGASLGLGLLVADAIAHVLGSSVFTGDFLTGPGLVIPLMLVALAALAVTPNLLALPSWARAREGQMEHLAGRISRVLDGSSEVEGGSSGAPSSRPGPSMLRFDVFGRNIGVTREGDRWVAVYLGSGTSRVAPEITIPPDLPRQRLGEFLADLFHESARPSNPDVIELSTESDPTGP